MHMHVHLQVQMHLKRAKDLQARLTDSTIEPMRVPMHMHRQKCL